MRHEIEGGTAVLVLALIFVAMALAEWATRPASGHRYAAGRATRWSPRRHHGHHGGKAVTP